MHFLYLGGGAGLVVPGDAAGKTPRSHPSMLPQKCKRLVQGLGTVFFNLQNCGDGEVLMHVGDEMAGID